jgi:tetratricopeptide (TPR) repeat protein
MSEIVQDQAIVDVGKSLRGAFGYEDQRVTCPNTGVPLPAQRFRASVVVPDDAEALVELLDGRLNRIECVCGEGHTILIPVVGVFEPTGEIVCVTAGASEDAMREVMSSLGPPFDRATYTPDYNGLLGRVIGWLDVLVRPFTVDLIDGRLGKRPRVERIAARPPALLIALRELADGRLPVRLLTQEGGPVPQELVISMAEAVHGDAVIGQLEDLMDEFGYNRFAGEVTRIPARAVSDKILARLAEVAAQHFKPVLKTVDLRNAKQPDSGQDATEDVTLDLAKVGPAYRAGLLNAAAHMVAERQDPQAANLAGLVRGLWKILGPADAGAILPREEDAPKLVSFEPLWDSSVPEFREAKDTPALEALLDDLQAMFTRLGMVDRYTAVLAGGIVQLEKDVPARETSRIVTDSGAIETEISRLLDALFESLAKRYQWNVSAEESEEHGAIAAGMLTMLFGNGQSAAAREFVTRFLDNSLDAPDYIAAYAFGHKAMAACSRAEAFETAGRIAQRLTDLFSTDKIDQQLSQAGPGLTVNFLNECGNVMRYLGMPEAALESYKLARRFLLLSDDDAKRANLEEILSLNEGLALRDLGRFVEALPRILRAAETEPKNGSHQTSLALLYLTVGRTTDAAAAADRAVAAVDRVSDRMGRIRALVIRAEAHRLLERRGEALTDLAEAMLLAPSDARETRLRIVAAAASVPGARSFQPGLIDSAEAVLSDELAAEGPLDQLEVRQYAMALWGLGSLLLDEGRDTECSALDRMVLTPFLESLVDGAHVDWRLLRLKGLIEHRNAKRWTAEGWRWLSAAAQELESKVPSGADAAFAASWLADKEAFQSELAEAGVTMVDERNLPAAALIPIYELANGRELSAGLATHRTEYHTEEESLLQSLANLASKITRPLVIFAFLDAGKSVRTLRILPASGTCDLLPGPGWDAARITAAARAFARGIAITNSTSPGAGERRMRPWLDLLEEIGQRLAPDLVPNALVCFLPGRGLTNLPLHLIPLPTSRSELLLSHPVVYAANLAVLLGSVTHSEGHEPTAARRLVVAVPKKGDTRSYRLRLAREARRLTHDQGKQRCVRRLSGRRATPDSVLQTLPDVDELVLLCHGVHIGDGKGYGLYLSNGRDLPPGMLVDMGAKSESRFVLSWNDFARLERSPSLIISLACQSARTLVGRGGIRIGPEAAAFARGTRAIVAPLWNVDQEASLAWVHAFETARVSAEGIPMTLWDAHREASLQLRADREPFFFWAPFVLSGPLLGGFPNAD